MCFICFNVQMVSLMFHVDNILKSEMVFRLNVNFTEFNWKFCCSERGFTCLKCSKVVFLF